MADGFVLPALRQELRIEPGAPLPCGAPSWTIFDPIRHLFFQIGALEHRILALWSLGDGAAVCAALPPGSEPAVVELLEFALANSLTRAPAGDTVAAFTARHAAAKRDWWHWLLDHYLFIRIPLLRPAAFLERTLPRVRAIWSPAGIKLLVALAVVGLFLVTREWDAFTGGFATLLTGQGIATYLLGLALVKCCHEAGHAYMATRFGCRVPAMGVAFLVTMPVLYTDTSAAWRLRSRRQRLLIDAAGVCAELSVAAVTLFLWSFLPDGAVRSMAFVLATTSLATTLLVNASPFMRFDGYYILSDLIGVANLGPRAFALGRWRLRRLLFAIDEPPPEQLPDRLRRGLVVYAWITWLYRVTLYVGIAILVYHLFFKALGIALFIVEVSVFLVRPIAAELRAWHARRAAILAHPRSRWLAAGLAAAAIACVLPLDRSMTLPAVLTPLGDQPLVAGTPARIERVLVADGATVAAGQPLLVLAAPDLVLGIAQARLRIAQLEDRLGRGTADIQDRLDRSVLERRLLTERDTLRGLTAQQDRLLIRAPFAGRVADLARDTAAGQWTDGRQPLLRVVTPARFDVQAYVDEDMAWRLADDASARFVPDDASAPTWRARLAERGAATVATIAWPQLTTAQGGPIAADPDRSGQPVARHGLVLTRFVAEIGTDDARFVQPRTGRVIVAASGESLLAKLVRAAGKLLVREASLD